MKYKIRYTIMSLFFTGILGWAMVDVAENPQMSASATKHPTVHSISIRHLMAPAAPVADADTVNTTIYYGTSTIITPENPNPIATPTSPPSVTDTPPSASQTPASSSASNSSSTTSTPRRRGRHSDPTATSSDTSNHGINI